MPIMPNAAKPPGFWTRRDLVIDFTVATDTDGNDDDEALSDSVGRHRSASAV
jgi:hypothetical protein